jgi:ATP-dependent Clp protease ATP-binding subunit ClpC
VVYVSFVAHNYTPHAQAAIAAAQSEAERSGSACIDPGHLLQALLGLPQCGAVMALAQLGVSTEAVQRGVQSQAELRTFSSLGSEPSRQFQAMKLLEFAAMTAQELKKPGYSCVGTEHLLLSILNDAESLPAQVLLELGVTAKQVRRVMAEGGGWAAGRD